MFETDITTKTPPKTKEDGSKWQILDKFDETWSKFSY